MDIAAGRGRPSYHLIRTSCLLLAIYHLEKNIVSKKKVSKKKLPKFRDTSQSLLKYKMNVRQARQLSQFFCAIFLFTGKIFKSVQFLVS